MKVYYTTFMKSGKYHKLVTAHYPYTICLEYISIELFIYNFFTKTSILLLRVYVFQRNTGKLPF